MTTDRPTLYVVDTHTLAWFLEDNSRLGPTARSTLRAPESRIAVPAMALAELAFLCQRGRIAISLATALRRIDGAANCTVCDMDREVIECMPTSLNIHDAIIVGTAIMCREVLGYNAILVTRDQEIGKSGLIEVLW